jgi:hypothetical protein
MKVHNHTDQQHEYKAGKDNTVYNNTVYNVKQAISSLVLEITLRTTGTVYFQS